MLNPYWVDLHVHTALSPCGELEMGAPEIVEAARAAGIDVIAVTDHNSSDNFPAISERAEGNPVVLPGIEVQTAEDIHVVAVFPDYPIAASFQSWLWKTWAKMPPTANDPDIFGDQVVIDKDDGIIRMEEVLLVQGTGCDVDTVVREIQASGGLAIMAHVDRPAFSYPSVLGPFPEDYPADAFELSWRIGSDQALEWRERYAARTFIRSSDSHMLESLDRSHCTKMYLEAPTFGEIRLALANDCGRRVSWPWG
ncbi:MAG: PHP domain-containing protein [Synergistaceae bacterium]|nr:PHP domain-containing protein [Synergistaceae bacterium]